jgi:general secretion pathway protein I
MAKPALINSATRPLSARRNPSAKPSRGFTLLEVLVALAIVAIALSAAVRATGISIDSSTAVRENLLASWVAQNRLAELTARHIFPALGSSSGSISEAGRNFTWEEIVTATPNSDFHRVEIQVRASGSGHVAASIIGYLSPMPEDK